MKTPLLITIFALCMSAATQAQTGAVLKLREDDTLTESLGTGAQTITISATGTLHWTSGATLAGSASALRTALGLAIGTDVQAQSATLTTLSSATAAGLALMDDADAAAQRTTLGLGAAVAGPASATDNALARYDSTTGKLMQNSAATLDDDGALLLVGSNGNMLLEPDNQSLQWQWLDSEDESRHITIDIDADGQDSYLMRLPIEQGVAGQALTINEVNGDDLTLVWSTPNLAISSTTISGSASGDILTSNGVSLQKLTPGTGVNTFLATPSSENFATAITGETGTGALVFATAPQIKGFLSLVKAGNEGDGAGLEVVDDPANPAVRSLYILPPQNSTRIYFGKSGLGAYSLNFSQVASFENTPSMQVGPNLFRVGGIENCFITRGDGGTEIGANHPTGYGLDVFQYDGFDTATIAHRAANVHRANGITYFGTSTSRTDYEGVNLGVASSVYHLWTIKGSGGGTARNLVLGTDSTAQITLEADGDVLLDYDALPTSDPAVKGQLWRDGATLKISPGP